MVRVACIYRIDVHTHIFGDEFFLEEEREYLLFFCIVFMDFIL